MASRPPTKGQYFFASDWPLRIWYASISLTAAVAVGVICFSYLNPLAKWMDLAWFAWYVMLGLVLGYVLAAFPGGLLIGLLYYDLSLKNGAPFKVGDEVQILSPLHRDRVSRVYALWQGNQVRVELGHEERENLQDIFAPVELLRLSDPVETDAVETDAVETDADKD